MRGNTTRVQSVGGATAATSSGTAASRISAARRSSGVRPAVEARRMLAWNPSWKGYMWFDARDASLERRFMLFVTSPTPIQPHRPARWATRLKLLLPFRHLDLSVIYTLLCTVLRPAMPPSAFGQSSIHGFPTHRELCRVQTHLLRSRKSHDALRVCPSRRGIGRSCGQLRVYCPGCSSLLREAWLSTASPQGIGKAPGK